MSEAIKKIQEYFSKMDPQAKRKLVLISLVVGVFGLAIGWSNTSKKSAAPPVLQAKDNKSSELLPDRDMLAKTEIGESRRQVDDMKKQLADQQKVLDQIMKEKMSGGAQPILGTPVASAATIPAAGTPVFTPQKAQKGQRVAANLPPLPLPSGSASAAPMPVSTPGSRAKYQQAQLPPMSGVETAPITPPKPTFRRVGDIEISENNSRKDPPKDPAGPREDKKKEPTIMLPSGSFMKTQLLNGVDAPIGGAGKSNPVPVLLRIQDIATLPSSVKMNLKGCFAICDGYGDLATRRANLQLRNISCLDRTGKAVIDQPVDGYLVDEDGKAGLKGLAVWKGADIVTRAAFAGFLQGIGQGAKTATTSTTTSALGSIATLGTSAQDIAIAGVGQGISTAADELQKMYMELVHQSLPVVSVGATKQPTLIIMKKTELVLHEVGGRRGGLQ